MDYFLDVVLIICCSIDVGLVALAVVQKSVGRIIFGAVAFGLCLSALVL